MTATSRWQVDGTAAELYERVAERYILGPWAPGLVQIAALRAGERVLDVACGTGAVARVAAAIVGPSGAVVGLDSSAGMLAVARSRASAAGAPIGWIERSASDSGLPDRSFDAVVCQQGLQFFPDKPAALREMHRVLAPGGRLALSVWRTTGVYNTAVAQALHERLGTEAARRFCASRDVPSAEDLLKLVAGSPFREAGLRVERLDVRLPSLEDFVPAHLAGTPLAAEIRAMNQAAQRALGGDVARRLAAYRDGDGVSFTEEVNVVTAVA
jgi:ubiquinone/menaquinone biosynthesis C-methylase UbiE